MAKNPIDFHMAEVLLGNRRRTEQLLLPSLSRGASGTSRVTQCDHSG